MFRAIKRLMSPTAKPKSRIGFRPNDQREASGRGRVAIRRTAMKERNLKASGRRDSDVDGESPTLHEAVRGFREMLWGRFDDLERRIERQDKNIRSLREAVRQIRRRRK